MCRFLGRLHDDPSARSGGRPRRSAKARNRDRMGRYGRCALWGLEATSNFDFDVASRISDLMKSKL
jgi:predicted ABC-type transport system involved in lysophospholipase L1 biosynthesis ATPase subunit